MLDLKKSREICEKAAADGRVGPSRIIDDDPSATLGRMAGMLPAALDELEAARKRIEELEWLVEVQMWKPRGTYSRCMGANDWYKQKTWPDRRDSYNNILAKALREAGYGE
jgi:hypothetical protein